MAKLAKEFEHVLIEPVKIAKGGEFVTSSNLLVKAPANAHRYNLLRLKQFFMNALPELMDKANLFNSNEAVVEAKEKNKEQKKDEDDGAGIMQGLFMTSVDMEKFFKEFRSMFCTGLILIDGVVPLTEHLYDQISIDDEQRLIERYLGNFLLSSWTSKG
jgi:hypothetical protein